MSQLYKHDEPPEEAPPSYAEATSAAPGLPNRPGAPAMPQRPPSHMAPHPTPMGSASPQPPARPPLGSGYQVAGSGAGGATPGSSSALYNNNPGLPWAYPRSHYCNKCKNSGFKVKNGDPCSDCWKTFCKSAYNPNPNLGFKYPRNYICKKCHNTGHKLKNGKLCQDCYSRFAPRNVQQRTHHVGYHQQHIYAPPAPGPPGMPPMAGMAMPVAPGDPRLGGVLCGKCRGRGQITFFLDDELCPLCGGLGRLINVQPQGYR